MDEVSLYIISYMYKDNTNRKIVGSIPITYNVKINHELFAHDFIYQEVENHIEGLGINIKDPNINIRRDWNITNIWKI